MTEAREDGEVVRLVTIALDLRERGIDPPVAEICADRPDLVAAVEQALSVVDRLPALGRASEQFNPLVDLLVAGRYRLVESIGTGSMGVVYRGSDEELGRPVAVKILRSDLLGGAQAESRFEREAEALAAIRHPSIVAVHDRGRTDDGLMYIVMEFVDGVSLAEVIRAAEHERDQLGDVEQVRGTAWLQQLLGDQARLESSYVRQCARWAWQLAEGLQAAHDAGVIHRDVKPSNVLVRRDGHPVLVDFGIAALHAQATLAAGERVVGTPSYMAPERLSKGAVTAAVDVYGLTATLYSALTLEPPYRGTPTEVLDMLARREPRPARALRRDLPRDLQAILDTGLARETSRRYASSRALHDDLLALLEHRPVVARPTHVVERAWRRAKRSPEVRVLAALGVLAVVALAAVLWISSHREHRRSEWATTWDGIGPTLCIAPPAIRRIHDGEALAAESARLDRLVELSDHPVPSLVLRAVFRLDQGDRQGAIDDFAAVARAVRTPLARELAKRYAELPPNATDVPLRGLPAPTSSEDHYLVAFHLVRGADVDPDPDVAAEALRLLREPIVRGSHFAAELALVVEGELAKATPDSERVSAFRELHLRAVRLEEVMRRSTATTHLVVGVALTEMGLAHEAVDPLRRGVELSPSDHALRIAFARALRAARGEEEALHQLEYAIRLRPESIGAHRNLADVLMDLRDFAAAEEEVRRVPFPDGDQGERARDRLMGRLRHRQALSLWRDGDFAGAAEAAKQAIRHYQSAGQRALEQAAEDVLVCRMLIKGRYSKVFRLLVEELAKSPLDWRDIQNVAAFMPDELEPEEVRALRDYLEAVSRQIAPETTPDITSRSLESPEKEPR